MQPLQASEQHLPPNCLDTSSDPHDLVYKFRTLNEILDREATTSAIGKIFHPLMRDMDDSDAIGEWKLMLLFSKHDWQRLLNWRNCEGHKRILAGISLNAPARAFDELTRKYIPGCERRYESQTSPSRESPRKVYNDVSSRNKMTMQSVDQQHPQSSTGISQTTTPSKVAGSSSAILMSPFNPTHPPPTFNARTLFEQEPANTKNEGMVSESLVSSTSPYVGRGGFLALRSYPTIASPGRLTQQYKKIQHPASTVYGVQPRGSLMNQLHIASKPPIRPSTAFDNQPIGEPLPMVMPQNLGHMPSLTSLAAPYLTLPPKTPAAILPQAGAETVATDRSHTREIANSALEQGPRWAPIMHNGPMLRGNSNHHQQGLGPVVDVQHQQASALELLNMSYSHTQAAIQPRTGRHPQVGQQYNQIHCFPSHEQQEDSLILNEGPSSAMHLQHSSPPRRRTLAKTPPSFPNVTETIITPQAIWNKELSFHNGVYVGEVSLGGLDASAQKARDNYRRKEQELLQYEREASVYARQEAEKSRIASERKARLRNEITTAMKSGTDILAYRYREYLEVFPLNGSERVSTFHADLLANQKLSDDDYSENARAVRFAKERWWNYWHKEKDMEDVLKIMKRGDLGLRQEMQASGHNITEKDLQVIQNASGLFTCPTSAV